MKSERGQGSTAIVAIFAIVILAALAYWFLVANQGGGDGGNIVIPTIGY